MFSFGHTDRVTYDPNQDRLEVLGLYVRDHTIECLAVHRHEEIMATGAASDIRIWQRDRNGKLFVGPTREIDAHRSNQ